MVKTEEIKEKYFEGIGRRKTARARVRFYPEEKTKTKKEIGITVNELNYKNYFPILRYQNATLAPLKVLPQKEGRIEVKVVGGGKTAQSEAITLGLARALVKFNPELRPALRAFGYLTRDPRMVERKKYGLRKARRARQWRKR